MNTFYVDLAGLWFCGNPELHLSLFVRKLVNHEPLPPLEYGVECNGGSLGSRRLFGGVWVLSLAVLVLWDLS